MKKQSDLDKFVECLLDLSYCYDMPCREPKGTVCCCELYASARKCKKAIRAALLKAAAPDVITEFVKRVNARAEQDILNGNPITGVHHRALEAELEEAQNGKG